MSFWKFIQFIAPTLLLLLITMTGTSSMELNSKVVTTRGITFDFEPHPDSDHEELHAILNGKYRRGLKMTVLEMQENERVYTNKGNGAEFINLKCVENIKEFFISKMISISPLVQSAIIRKE